MRGVHDKGWLAVHTPFVPQSVPPSLLLVDFSLPLGLKSHGPPRRYQKRVRRVISTFLAHPTDSLLTFSLVDC